MTVDLHDFFSPHILEIEKRFTGAVVDSDWIKLNANENTYPLPYWLLRDLEKGLSGCLLNRYPNNDFSEVKQALAKHFGCEKDQILIENWSSNALSLLFHALLSKDEVFATTTPSFVLYPYLAKVHEVEYKEFNYISNINLPVDELIAVQAKVIILANPNNPTWSAYPLEYIERILKYTKSIVIIDEAYIDFWGETAISLLKKYTKLIITRTFSKSFALAWARIGVIIAHPEIIAQLEKLQAPFHLTRFTQKTILTALNYTDKFWQHIQKIKRSREQFQTFLQNKWFIVIPSSTNFIFIQGHQNLNFNFSVLEKYFIQHKIKVMIYPKKMYGKIYMRITIGTEEEMKKVEQIIEYYMSNVIIQ